MKYKFRYRRQGKWFWQTKEITGHQLNPDIDRMDLYLEDGSIYSLGKWSEYDLKLGTDWVVSTKKKMEDESGQNIKLKSKIGE